MAEIVAAHALFACDDAPILVDTRPVTDWRTGTIPGAINLDVYEYFIARSDEEGIADMVRAAASAWALAALDQGRDVVFFEEATGMRSPRGLWFHEMLGHHHGAILDGGIAAWRAAGGILQPGTGPTLAVSAGATGVVPSFRREFVVSTAEVLAGTGRDFDLLDVRRRSEFDGSFVHACCARGGRIPGAKFLFYEDMLEDGRYRSASEIRAMAEAATLSPRRRIVTYCHRGARAATALYGLRRAGFGDIRIYVGSWHEWAGDPVLPLHSGG
jgi:thiosulfate/3-mercaptopyruvate sulfurtransferase